MTGINEYFTRLTDCTGGWLAGWVARYCSGGDNVVVAVGAAVGGRVSCGGQACLLQMTKRRLWCRVTVAEWVAVRFAGCVNVAYVSV